MKLTIEGVLEHRFRLLSGNPGKPIEEVLQPCAGLQVLEKGLDGHARARAPAGLAFRPLKLCGEPGTNFGDVVLAR
jgi:hypothetical protein